MSRGIRDRYRLPVRIANVLAYEFGYDSSPSDWLAKSDKLWSLPNMGAKSMLVLHTRLKELGYDTAASELAVHRGSYGTMYRRYVREQTAIEHAPRISL